MWVCLLLVAVFTGLLTTTSLWLYRRRTIRTHEARRHAAPRRAVAPHHA
ncbi:hypothetical protein ACIGD1_26130 [Streptomyces sp. NPDC085612]